MLGAIEQLANRVDQQFHVAVGRVLFHPMPSRRRRQHPQNGGRRVESCVGGLVGIVRNQPVRATVGRQQAVPLAVCQPFHQGGKWTGTDARRSAGLHQRDILQINLARGNRALRVEDEIHGENPA